MVTTVLITGGHRGIGFETARQPIDLGRSVWMRARDAQRGHTVAEAIGAK